MSLLEQKTEKYRFIYQLPMSFDKQLEIVDKIGSFYNYYAISNVNAVPRIQLSKVWEFIKNEVSVYDLKNKEAAIWKQGGLVDEKYQADMLAISIESSKFFMDKFEVFISGLGVNLTA